MDIYYAASTCTGKWQISRVVRGFAPNGGKAPGAPASGEGDNKLKDSLVRRKRMAIQFKKTQLAAAVAAAAMGLGLSTAANAVVVVGGDNGWEVSFDGNINAFYVNGDYDAGYDNLGYTAPLENCGAQVGPAFGTCVGGAFNAADNTNVSRITSGFLPAFFSANIKSPTVNGMTGTARFSFAPQITNGTTKNQLYAGDPLSGSATTGIQGSSIDMREVVVNLEGGFGTVSFGRTLSIFGRNAILKDMTLFGVGQSNMYSSAVTAGRIGRGYTYPNFNARFSYKTPNLAGFQAEIGLYDPATETALRTGADGRQLNQTDTPRFEAEANYTTAFSGGSLNFWADALYQDLENQSNAMSGDATVHGWGVGSEVKYAGFGLTGYYYGGEGLGRSLQFLGGTACNFQGNVCESTDNDGYYLQGTYTFGGKTKLGMSYGESTEDAFGNLQVLGNVGEAGQRDVKLSMWTVGVYHDLNSWLKLIAEYSHSKNDFGANDLTIANGGVSNGTATEADTFSLGTFFFW
jgi:hypothetical protein